MFAEDGPDTGKVDAGKGEGGAEGGGGGGAEAEEGGPGEGGTREGKAKGKEESRLKRAANAVQTASMVVGAWEDAVDYDDEDEDEEGGPLSSNTRVCEDLQRVAFLPRVLLPTVKVR